MANNAAFSDVEHPWSWLYREEVKCTCCNEQINPFGVWYRHPVMNTVQCGDCNKFYSAGKFSKDSDGYYEHCRWCGEGGTLYGCDFCIESFCKQCILRNLSRAAITEIEAGTKWKCYICNTDRTKDCRNYATKIEESVSKFELHETEKKIRKANKKLEKYKMAVNEKKEADSTGGNNGESTDEDEIDAKLLSLFDILEGKLEKEGLANHRKHRIFALVKKNAGKFSNLKTKCNKIIKGPQSSGDDTSDSDENDREKELLGVKSKKKTPRTSAASTPKGKLGQKSKIKLGKRSKKQESSPERSDSDKSESENNSSDSEVEKKTKAKPKTKIRLTKKRPNKKDAKSNNSDSDQPTTSKKNKKQDSSSEKNDSDEESQKSSDDESE